MSACGTWAFFHVPSERLVRWFCGSGKCPREKCRKKFWSARVRLISALVEEYSLIRFFTLTLDRGMIEGDPWEYVHRPWSKFRKRMKRRHTEFRFVAILEAHKDSRYPHIHGFTDIWMTQKQWSKTWQECKGGRIVWVEKVKDANVSEYVSKTLEVAKYVGKEQLLDGYKQRGKHRSLWRSENTRAKYELTQSEDWVMIKETVFKESGELTDFFAKKGLWSDGEKKYQGKDMERTCGSLPE